MNVISPRLRRAALLGALLLPVSQPADSLAAAGGVSSAGSQLSPPGHSEPGSSGAPTASAGRCRQMLFRLRRSNRAGAGDC
jgi:hypothetical protein